MEKYEIEIFVGTGVSAYTMKRGSFQYKQTITSKQALHLMQEETKDGGADLKYADRSGRLTAVFHYEETADSLRMTCVSCSSGINRFWISFPSDPQEKIYGCGEVYAKLNLKNEKVRIWVAEHQNSSRISKKIIRNTLLGKHPDRTLPFDQYESYYAQPTYVSNHKYYLHSFTTGYAEFDFTEPKRTTLMFCEKPSIQIEKADTYEALSEKLSALLGRQKKLPDWIYNGVILGIQQGTAVVDKKIEEAAEHGIQVTGVWCQDWSGCRRTKFGYQVMWNWQCDEELYPDLKNKIAEWKQMGVHFLGYINPFMAIEKELYQTAHEKGYCVKNASGEDYLVTITTFPAAMIDFTNPDAYAWYKNIIKENMLGLGMSGWMADFGEYLPTDAVLFSGDNPYLIHNEWPAIWARMNREAIEECGRQNEVFFFTRAGYTGSIQDSFMMWTGDQHVDWSKDDGIPSVIPATLSLAMSGCGITHSDIGGYTTIMNMTRSKELLMRWEEMNVFSPLMRSHEGNQPVKNVQYDTDEELMQHMAVCSKMHAALKDYLQACIAEEAAKGTPVMRPLFYHYEQEPAYQEETEYLLGRDILCAPIIREKETSRTVYLPEDTWVHVWSRKEYSGGCYKINAPIGYPPVFIRKNSAECQQLIEQLNQAQKGNQSI